VPNFHEIFTEISTVKFLESETAHPCPYAILTCSIRWHTTCDQATGKLTCLQPPRTQLPGWSCQHRGLPKGCVWHGLSRPAGSQAPHPGHCLSQPALPWSLLLTFAVWGCLGVASSGPLEADAQPNQAGPTCRPAWHCWALHQT
jgi:hypothetical protein